jgi:hypothetical protein
MKGDAIVKISYKDTIYIYICEKYQVSEPIIQKDLYQEFGNLNKVTIRQSLLRLSEEKKLIKSPHIQGTFFLPNPNLIFDIVSFDFNKLIEQKYLFNKERKRIGYIGGFVFANQIGLSTQTSNVLYVYSNDVSDRKRKIQINGRRVIINRPKIEVNEDNYRFLQVLDLISDFNKYVEYSIDKANIVIKQYLSNLTLSKKVIETILNQYPIKTQLNYYKLEVDHVITPR